MAREVAYEMTELDEDGAELRLEGKKQRNTCSKLKHLPRGFYQLMLMLFMESFASFAMTINLTTYLHSVFLMSDSDAGYYYAMWGVVIFLLSIPMGFLIDSVPLSVSFIVSALTLAASRLVFALSPFESVTLASLFTVMALGFALVGQLFPITINRYFDETTEDGQEMSTFAYSVAYSVMNAGAVLSGWMTDICLSWGDYDGYHRLFGISAGATIVLWALCLVYHPPPLRLAPGNVAVRRRYLSEKSRVRRAWLVTKDSAEDILSSCKELIREPVFWKLTLFTLFLTPVKSMFTVLNSFFPNFMKRVYPNYGYGTVLSINPILIIFLGPPISFLTSHFLRDYGWIVVGSLISSLSAVWLWLWPSFSAAPLFCFVVTFTVGESIYSARSGQYVVEKSPAGKKAIYGILTSFPSSVGHAVAGILSGRLLEYYYPDDVVPYDKKEAMDYRREGAGAWFAIFIFSATSAALLLISSRYLSIDDAGSNNKRQHKGIFFDLLRTLKLA